MRTAPWTLARSTVMVDSSAQSPVVSLQLIHRHRPSELPASLSCRRELRGLTLVAHLECACGRQESNVQDQNPHTQRLSRDTPPARHTGVSESSI